MTIRMSSAANTALKAASSFIFRNLGRVSGRELPFARQRKILLENRRHLWERGGIGNIKRGRYFTTCEWIVPANAHLFDRVVRNKQDYGWSYGLESNIYLRIGGKHVLVMDNHNFAAAFIVEMFGRGIIRVSKIHCCSVRYSSSTCIISTL